MYGGEERRDEKCLPHIEAGELYPTAIASKAMIAHRRGCDSRRHSWSDLVIYGSQRETNNKLEARGGRRHDGDERSGGLRGKDVFHSRVSRKLRSQAGMTPLHCFDKDTLLRRASYLHLPDLGVVSGGFSSGCPLPALSRPAAQVTPLIY